MDSNEKPKQESQRSYASPKLRIYGDVVEMTAGGSGQSDEGSMDMTTTRRVNMGGMG